LHCVHTQLAHLEKAKSVEIHLRVGPSPVADCEHPARAEFGHRGLGFFLFQLPFLTGVGYENLLANHPLFNVFVDFFWPQLNATFSEFA
jgi:hypothetical protein